MTRDRLLTAVEVGERLALPVTTVWRLARVGELPAVRVGGRLLRFDPAALERWLAAGGSSGPRGQVGVV